MRILIKLFRCDLVGSVHFSHALDQAGYSAYIVYMPPKSVYNKTPCSLCHKVVEELKFHYDICEPCHQDFVNAEPEESDMEEPESEEDYCSDDDVMSGEDPTVEDELEKSSVVLEEAIKTRNADGSLPKRDPSLKRC